jgi:hypothetical protein
MPNTNVKRNTPNAGDAKTIKDTAKDNTPTPTRKPFDHFEVFLSEMPWMILAIPVKSRPRASKVTSTPVANRGNAITAIPNKAAKAPRPIFPNLDDFECFDSVRPVTNLSIPTTSNVIESRKVRVAIPTPGFTITASDSAMAIPPSTICRVRMPLGELIVSVFKVIHLQKLVQLLDYKHHIHIYINRYNYSNINPCNISHQIPMV